MRSISCGDSRLGLEGGDTIGNALIVDRRNRGCIGERCRARLQFGSVDHSYAATLGGPDACWYQPRVRNTIRTTESMTGTSTSTPTTVANAAPIESQECDRRGDGELEEIRGADQGRGTSDIVRDTERTVERVGDAGVKIDLDQIGTANSAMISG